MPKEEGAGGHRGARFNHLSVSMAQPYTGGSPQAEDVMPARVAVLASFALASVAIAQEVPPAQAKALLEEQYQVTPGADGTLVATNPSQGMEASFAPRGFQVSGPGWTLGLRLESWGRGCDQTNVEQGKITGVGRCVRIERAGITEWFVNDRAGLEHGFTIHEKPDGNGLLRLVLATEGGLVATVLPGDRDVSFTGSVSISYSGLSAWDANGRELETRFSVDESGLAILAEDADAAYPLTVDPMIWVETARLHPNSPRGRFGYSVAISGDSSLVGAPYLTSDAWAPGAAYVFTRTGTVWCEEAMLSYGILADGFGHSVSICGNTALIGARYADSPSESGAAHVFSRTGTAWSQQPRLTASDAAEDDYFGWSVSISGDTALVGAPGSNNNCGAAYVLVRSGTTWSQQAKLMAADAEAWDWFGHAVSLCGDTALVGASRDDDGLLGTSSGSAYIFVRTGTVWNLEAKITASDAAAGDCFGFSVSLSGDTALVGAPTEDPSTGAPSGWGKSYAFVRAGTVWNQQAKLTALDAEIDDWFGCAVAVSGDVAVVGSCYGAGWQGRSYAFVRTGTAWSQEGRLLLSGSVPPSESGFAVAVEAGTALIGQWGGGHAYVCERITAPTATSSWYCGSSVNIDTYTISNGFELGGTFQGTVAIPGPNLGAIVAGYLGRLTFPMWGQEGLVDVSKPEVLGLPSGFGWPTVVTWPVPSDPAYAGYHVFTQAAGIGGGVINLTCAHDCTAGY